MCSIYMIFNRKKKVHRKTHKDTKMTTTTAIRTVIEITHAARDKKHSPSVRTMRNVIKQKIYQKKMYRTADETGHIVLPLNVSTASHFCYAHIAGQIFCAFFSPVFVRYILTCCVCFGARNAQRCADWSVLFFFFRRVCAVLCTAIAEFSFLVVYSQSIDGVNDGGFFFAACTWMRSDWSM